LHTIADISEKELYERLKNILNETANSPESGVHLGIGDDAAVMETSPHKHLISSCDIMIEGRHFDLQYTNPRDLGFKALAVNISDVASMGGTPRWAMVSLALPGETTLLFWEEFYRGMRELAEQAGVAIVGGDTTSSSKIVVDVSIMGEAKPSQIISRSNASPGEKILVTGSLGSSAAGLSWLQSKVSLGCLTHEEAKPLVQAHLQPLPRFREAYFIREVNPGAMIDLSDGLAAGVDGICASSGVGARINYSSLPYLPVTLELSRRTGFPLEDWILYGGEDFELLFTVPKSKSLEIAEELTKITNTPATVIGEILPAKEGMHLIFDGGEKIRLETGRIYRHFTDS